MALYAGIPLAEVDVDNRIIDDNDDDNDDNDDNDNVSETGSISAETPENITFWGSDSPPTESRYNHVCWSYLCVATGLCFVFGIGITSMVYSTWRLLILLLVPIPAFLVFTVLWCGSSEPSIENSGCGVGGEGGARMALLIEMFYLGGLAVFPLGFIQSCLGLVLKPLRESSEGWVVLLASTCTAFLIVAVVEAATPILTLLYFQYP